MAAQERLSDGPGAAAPIITLHGDRVMLGPLRRDLLPLYQRWNNDLAVTRTTASSRPTTLEQETAAYDRLMAADEYVLFTIYEVETGRPIGTTYLGGIDLRNRTAEFGIALGEAEYRGKGYGTEVTRLVLDYAFTVLGLHSVILVVYAFNLAGQHAYQKAGFREFGHRRQAHLMGGQLWDVIYMECLATEFSSPVLEKLLAPELDSTEGGTEART